MFNHRADNTSAIVVIFGDDEALEMKEDIEEMKEMDRPPESRIKTQISPESIRPHVDAEEQKIKTMTENNNSVTPPPSKKQKTAPKTPIPPLKRRFSERLAAKERIRRRTRSASRKQQSL